MSTLFGVSSALRFASAILMCMGLAAQDREPIAYIGHGAMFDQEGRELPQTLSFLRDAQAWYRNNLSGKLNRNQRAAFDKFELGMKQGLDLDPQSQLVLNSRMLDWLLDNTRAANADRIRGKLNLIKVLLKNKLPETLDGNGPRNVEPFNVNPDLLKRLEAAPQKKSSTAPILKIVTANGGAAYRAECQANGVPLPPDIGTAGWTSRGTIPQNELFIVASLQAEVLTFNTATPEGMCIALPRFDVSNNVQLDGIICLGKASSKACFFDNDVNGTQFTFQRGTTVPFTNFGGGTELVGSVGGICSDCHAGENPYVIHGTVLNSLAAVPLPTFPVNWYDPIVQAGWPQNPGPMNAPVDCKGCHFQGFAGHSRTFQPIYQAIAAACFAPPLAPCRRP